MLAMLKLKKSFVGKSIMNMEHTCTLQNKKKQKTVLLYQVTIMV